MRAVRNEIAGGILLGWSIEGRPRSRGPPLLLAGGENLRLRRLVDRVATRFPELLRVADVFLNEGSDVPGVDGSRWRTPVDRIRAGVGPRLQSSTLRNCCRCRNVRHGLLDQCARIFQMDHRAKTMPQSITALRGQRMSVKMTWRDRLI